MPYLVLPLIKSTAPSQKHKHNGLLQVVCEEKHPLGPGPGQQLGVYLCSSQKDGRYQVILLVGPVSDSFSYTTQKNLFDTKVLSFVLFSCYGLCQCYLLLVVCLGLSVFGDQQ